jgi:fructose-1,6-bisphosphatase/inositol monophosphatase family enzyme
VALGADRVPPAGAAAVGDPEAHLKVVSRVDREAERLLTDGLAELTPGLPVVGEEAVSADPSLLGALHGDRPVWLVDPLDGTTQFLAGSPDHAIMLALVDRGRTVAAVVHQPQHGGTYTAELGSGTWRDGVRLHRAPADPGDLARLRGAVLRRFLPPDARRAVEENEDRFGGLRPLPAGRRPVRAAGRSGRRDGEGGPHRTGSALALQA